MVVWRFVGLYSVLVEETNRFFQDVKAQHKSFSIVIQQNPIEEVSFLVHSVSGPTNTKVLTSFVVIANLLHTSRLIK